MPAGSLANASSVGANTVSLSVPERTPSSLAATMAATKVLWMPVPLADSTMFCNRGKIEKKSSFNMVPRHGRTLPVLRSLGAGAITAWPRYNLCKGLRRRQGGGCNTTTTEQNVGRIQHARITHLGGRVGHAQGLAREARGRHRPERVHGNQDDGENNGDDLHG